MRLVPILLAACTAAVDTPVSGDPSGEGPLQPWDPEVGEIVADIGPEGGVVGHADVWLEIPAGALDRRVTFHLTDRKAPTSHELLTDAWRFTPTDVRFAIPAQVVFAADVPEDALVYGGTPVGGWARRTTTHEKGLVRGDITSPTDVFVAPPGPETAPLPSPRIDGLHVHLSVDTRPAFLETRRALSDALADLALAADDLLLDWRITADGAGERLWVDGRDVVDPETPERRDALTRLLAEPGAQPSDAILQQVASGLTSARVGQAADDVVLAVLATPSDDDSTRLDEVKQAAAALELAAQPSLGLGFVAISGGIEGCDLALPAPRLLEVVAELDGRHGDVCGPGSSWDDTLYAALQDLPGSRCQPVPSWIDLDSVRVFSFPRGTPLPDDGYTVDVEESCVRLTQRGRAWAAEDTLGVVADPSDR